MILKNSIIEFKGLPLFQNTRFKTPITMEGSSEDMACFFYVKEGGLESVDARGAHRIGAKEALAKNCGSYIQTFVSATHNNECEVVVVFLHREIIMEIYKDEVPFFLKKDGAKHPEKFVSNELVDQYMNSLYTYFNNPSLMDEALSTKHVIGIVFSNFS
jgi:hypothetical protein